MQPTKVKKLQRKVGLARQKKPLPQKKAERQVKQKRLKIQGKARLLLLLRSQKKRAELLIKRPEEQPRHQSLGRQNLLPLKLDLLKLPVKRKALLLHQRPLQRKLLPVLPHPKNLKPRLQRLPQKIFLQKKKSKI